MSPKINAYLSYTIILILLNENRRRNVQKHLLDQCAFVMAKGVRVSLFWLLAYIAKILYLISFFGFGEEMLESTSICSYLDTSHSNTKEF